MTREEGAAWLYLCAGAKAAITRRIRPQTDTAACLEGLLLAAGAMAFRDYTLMKGSDTQGVQEARVGDVTVKLSGESAAEEARRLAQHFLEQVAYCLVPESIAFRLTGGAEQEETHA